MFLAVLGRRVDVLRGEGGSQAVDQDLGQGEHQLILGDDDVDAIRPGLDHVQALHRQRQPVLEVVLRGRVQITSTQKIWVYFLSLPGLNASCYC